MTSTTDPRWTAPTRLSALDRTLLRLVRDPRDLIVVRTAAEITVGAVPLAALMVALPAPWMWLALPFYVVFMLTRFLGRYQLMCHVILHRPVFRKEHGWARAWVFWGLGPLFGSTPTSFNAHHMGMHHPENNMEDDLSSTLPYQRDRFAHFLHYWARFFFPGLIHLSRYLQNRKRTKLARSLLVGELAWFGMVFALAWFDPAAAVGILVIPIVLTRWFMMCGNWAQHAFVDVDDANNAYRNSTNVINSRYNHLCFNDGYHIVHHLKGNLHWSEMAQYYDDHREEFARQDAIVFDGIGNNQVIWWCLMTQDYDRLAKHVVNFHGRTHDEMVAFLQGRVRRQRGEIKPMWTFEPLVAQPA